MSEDEPRVQKVGTGASGSMTSTSAIAKIEGGHPAVEITEDMAQSVARPAAIIVTARLDSDGAHAQVRGIADWGTESRAGAIVEVSTEDLAPIEEALVALAEKYKKSAMMRALVDAFQATGAALAGDGKGL